MPHFQRSSYSFLIMLGWILTGSWTVAQELPPLASYCVTARCDKDELKHFIHGVGRTRGAAKQDAMNQAQVKCKGSYTFGDEEPCPVKSDFPLQLFAAPIAQDNCNWVVCGTYQYRDGECLALKFEGPTKCDAVRIAQEFFRDFYDPCRPACLRICVLERPSCPVQLPLLTCEVTVRCPDNTQQILTFYGVTSEGEAVALAAAQCAETCGGSCTIESVRCYSGPIGGGVQPVNCAPLHYVVPSTIVHCNVTPPPQHCKPRLFFKRLRQRQ